METFSVNDLAEKISRIGSLRGHNVAIENIENPRKEAEEHYYNPKYQGLIEIGVVPHYLTDEVMTGIFHSVSKHKERIRKDIIFNGIKW